jgi:hypothetical protein
MPTDSFDRADSGTLGANWAETEDGFQIASNLAAPLNNAASKGELAYYVGTFDAGQYSQSTAAGDPFIWGVVARISGTGDGYGLLGGDNYGTGYKIVKVTNGFVFDVASIAGVGTLEPGDVMRIEVSGTTIRAYKNGGQIGTDQSDATYSGGNPGIYGWFITADRHNDFDGNDLVVIRRWILGTH